MVRKYYKYTMILWILKADDDEFEKDSKDSELDCDSDNQLIYYYVHSSGYIKKKIRQMTSLVHMEFSFH